MGYKTDFSGTRYTFASLKVLLAKATPERTGDQLAGLAAEGALERLAAQVCLADVPLSAFLDDVLEVDGDAVPRLIAEQHDAKAFAKISSRTVGSFRDWLLDPATTGQDLAQIAWGLTPETAAAVS